MQQKIPSDWQVCANGKKNVQKIPSSLVSSLNVRKKYARKYLEFVHFIYRRRKFNKTL